MKQYGFLVAERTSRWRVAFPDRENAEELPSKDDAETVSSEWWRREKVKKDEELEKAVEKSAREREEFRAKTKLDVVTVRNPKPFQADFRKPTITFPDGSQVQFEEGTLTELIENQIDARAWKAHPEPSSEHPDFKISEPSIDEIPVWEAEVILAGERRQLPEIKAWDHYFPMEGVTAALDGLAEEGWTVASVSEDRGLYASDVATNRSAPVLVRYLLVRERTT